MSNIFYQGFIGGSSGTKGVCTVVVSGEEFEDPILSSGVVIDEISEQTIDLLHCHGREGVDTVSTTFDLNDRRICLELSLVPGERIESVMDQIQTKSFGTCNPFTSEARNEIMERFNSKPSLFIVTRVVYLPDLIGLTDD